MTEEDELLQHQKLESEIEKLNLEKVKLTVEIKNLSKPQFWTPQSFASIATVLIAALGFILTFMTGLWDVKRTFLENQKTLLQIDISKFQKQKDSINLLVIQSQMTLDSVKKENKLLKLNFEKTNQQLKEISIKYKSEKQSIIEELNQIDILLKENKTADAFKKIADLVEKFNGLTGRSFNNDFNNDFK